MIDKNRFITGNNNELEKRNIVIGILIEWTVNWKEEITRFVRKGKRQIELFAACKHQSERKGNSTKRIHHIYMRAKMNSIRIGAEDVLAPAMTAIVWKRSRNSSSTRYTKSAKRITWLLWEILM